MQTGQHIAASQRFLDNALMLESEGSHMGAAEMIWGAAVQALEAIGHISSGNTVAHLSGNGRRRLASSTIRQGFRRYSEIQNGLHAHFYRGHLTPEEQTEQMRQGRGYVAELLTVALSSHAEPNAV